MPIQSMVTWNALISMFMFVLALVAFSFKANKVVKDSNQNILTVIEEKLDKRVRKDLCKVIHENLNRDITEIKTDVKTLLKRSDR